MLRQRIRQGNPGIQMMAISLVVVALAGAATFKRASAQEQGTRWAVTESFALGVDRGESGYPVVAFIPRSFLLFNLNAEEARDAVGSEYTAATTQDGFRVFVHRSVVSKSTIQGALGDPDIIFNQTRAVCRKPSCSLDDADQVFEISAGEVFRKTDLDSDIVELAGARGDEQVIGYISGQDLVSLDKQGIITQAKRPLPRLSVIRESAPLPGLECGQNSPKRDQVGTEILSDADGVVFDVLDIAEVAGNRVTYKKEYGGPNESYEFRVYKFTDHWFKEQVGGEFIYVAQIVYDCSVVGGLTTTNFAKMVQLRSPSQPPVTMSIGPTPPDLRQFTGSPYLFSVNKPEHYFDLMSKLGEQFGSRALAGYFMAEFNRSCSGKYRKKRDLCLNYSYAEVQ